MVTFRWWKIAIRKNAKIAPGEIKDTYEDFLDDARIQSEIHRVFGKGMLDYVMRLAEGHFDYLPRLPESILIQVIRYLDLEDITSLSQVSKKFRDLCNSDTLWEQIYHDHSETATTDELRSLAEAMGWKKLFFTNKLQVQVQLRRQSRMKQQRDSLSDDVESIDLDDGSSERRSSHGHSKLSWES